MDKNPDNNQRVSTLHVAVENGHFEITELIINSVKNKIFEDCRGKTPLHIAVEQGNFEISELIPY